MTIFFNLGKIPIPSNVTNLSFNIQDVSSGSMHLKTHLFQKSLRERAFAGSQHGS